MAPRKSAAPAATAAPSPAAQESRAAERVATDAVKAAEDASTRAADEGREPENTAIANPAPAEDMENAGGGFVEPAIKDGIPVEHPSIDNNPRLGTSSVQNGMDMNDPRGRRHPEDDEFAGQGVDLNAYGKGGK